MKGLAWLLPALLVLVGHAAWYGVICDDAYIAARYAYNLAHHGALVYNLGERVEGFTSPLWVFLLTPLLAAGASAETAVRVLGAASAALLVLATGHAASRVTPHGRLWPALTCLLLATSAPVAAWTLSGLETPLFAGAVTLAIALTLRFREDAGPRWAAGVGAGFGLATLVRPEGALVFACVYLVLALTALREARSFGPLRWLLPLLGAFLAVAGAYELFRLAYFGEPVPNTFYVKTTGDRRAAFELGLRYLQAGGLQLAVVALGLLLPLVPYRRLFGARVSPELGLLVTLTRVLFPAYLLYVASIGGDFLDLARFLVPLAPLAACLLVATLALALAERSLGPRPLAAVLGALALGNGLFGLRTGQRALLVADPDKAALGLEPFGWTKEKARQWAATGRWIRAHAAPGDWMAVGAAGAMPYYAGISNLDTFGLCDAFVARHGLVAGVRPGHQRWAPASYVLSKRPAFIFIGDQLTDAAIPTPRSRPFGADYVWVQAIVREDRHRAPRTFFHTLLVRKDRAEQLARSADVMAAGPS